jgi:hypothetical protein
VNEAATPSDKVNIQRLDLANLLLMAYLSKRKRPKKMVTLPLEDIYGF